MKQQSMQFWTEFPPSFYTVEFPYSLAKNFNFILETKLYYSEFPTPHNIQETVLDFLCLSIVHPYRRIVFGNRRYVQVVFNISLFTIMI